MRLQLVKAAGDTRHFDEIVNAFTPPMKRVCRHLAAADLREMVERMAMQQLADEQQRRVSSRRAASRRRPVHRPLGTLHVC